ncbi:MAG: hypothetical protein PWQ55_2420 [Chloroflexota bacterium]|nr:hypothetical protein [Chloroflexota bacterium]
MNTQNDLMKTALGNIASREFPEGTTLLRGQPADAPRVIAYWKRHPVLAIALMLITLATAAFCFFKLFFDPGLTGVRNAGLGTNPDSNAVPTLLPPTPTSEWMDVPPTMLDQSQTHQDVTIQLEWIALNNTGLVVGFQFTDLPEGQTIGVPEAIFENVEALDLRGRLLQLYSGETHTGEFTSLQVINDPHAENGVDLSLKVPLIDAQGNVVDTFIFPLKNIPINSTSPQVGQFSRADKIDNVMVRLDWAVLAPEMTQLKFCYTSSQGATPLRESDVHIQAGRPTALDTQATAADILLPAPDEDEMTCTIAQFNRNFIDEDTPALMTIDRIGEMTRTWTLLVEPTKRGPFSEMPAATPTPRPTPDSQSASTLSANLSWAYADRNRIALEIQFDGWQDSFLVQSFSGKDAQGSVIEGYAMPYREDNPADYLLQLSFLPDMLNDDGTVSMQLDVPVYDRSQPDLPLASFHFDLNNLQVYPEINREINQSVTVNGITVQIVEIRYTPSFSNIVLCYNKPPNVGTNGDWWPGHKEMTLTIGEITTTFDSGYFLTDSDPRYSGGGPQPSDLPSIPNGRCIELGFPVGNLADENAVPAKLVIPQLEVSQPEVIPQEDIDAANAILQDQGIQVEQHVFFSGSGGGGGGPNIVQKPDGMSDEVALEKFYQALGYQYAGPWILAFELPAE